MSRRPGPLARHHAVLRIFRVARRCGRLERRDALGEVSAAALRQARRLAAELGCLELDLDDATMLGLEAGRAGWWCSLLDFELNAAHNLPTPEQTSPIDPTAGAA